MTEWARTLVAATAGAVAAGYVLYKVGVLQSPQKGDMVRYCGVAGSKMELFASTERFRPRSNVRDKERRG